MKQYFISGTWYQTKNSAHEQAQKIAMNYNHCLIDEKRLQDLIETFLRRVDEINRTNKRCKNIELIHRKFELAGFESQLIAIEGNFNLHITPVERFELSKPTGKAVELTHDEAKQINEVIRNKEDVDGEITGFLLEVLLKIEQQFPDIKS